MPKYAASTSVSTKKVVALSQRYPLRLAQVEAAAAVAPDMETLEAACDLAVHVPTYYGPWGNEPMTPLLALALIAEIRSAFAGPGTE